MNEFMTETERLALHAKFCRNCKKWNATICGRVLYGGHPPEECPLAIEHIIGDQKDED